MVLRGWPFRFAEGGQRGVSLCCQVGRHEDELQREVGREASGDQGLREADEGHSVLVRGGWWAVRVLQD